MHGSVPQEQAAGAALSAVGRRRFLALAALSITGVAALLRATAYPRSDRRIAYMRALSAWEVAVVDALAERICAADVPYGEIGSPPPPRECEVVEFVDGFVADSSREIQRELHAALGSIEHVFPMLIGSPRRFTSLSTADQDRVLLAMHNSSIDLIRGCFAGVKSIVMMGYYRDPRTWGVLGYDGPLVSRPEGGWVPLRYKP